MWRFAWYWNVDVLHRSICGSRTSTFLSPSKTPHYQLGRFGHKIVLFVEAADFFDPPTIIVFCLISGLDQTFAAQWPYNWFAGQIFNSFCTCFECDVGCIKCLDNVIFRPARRDLWVFHYEMAAVRCDRNYRSHLDQAIAADI